jgi:uncharacterized protein
LVKHCLAVEAAMRALANHFGEDQDRWGVAGLLHDADWEVMQNDPEHHTRKTVEWMKEVGITDESIIQAILSHNYKHNGERPPQTAMEWSLYTCDELTGIIVATTLVRPDKKLASVDVNSVMKKFKTKSFAAAVDRTQIQMCEEKLDIPLPQFTQMILSAMQAIAPDLGL